MGDGVVDAGERPVNDTGGDTNVSDSGESYDVCPFGRNAVPLERAVTRPFSWFGLPVVADGSTIVVGAPIEREQPYSPPPVKGCEPPDTAQLHGSGTVRVYERNAGHWDETQLTIDGIEQSNPIVPPELLPQDVRLGVYQTAALAISGDWLAVGQGGDSSKADNQGSVRLFHRILGRWTPVGGHVENPKGRKGDLFGVSLAISGDTLVVGAPGEDDVQSGTPDVGAAYIYTLGPDGPGPGTPIVSTSPTDGGWFGVSVAISSDHVVVGAPLEDGITKFGMVHVFEKDGRYDYRIPGAASVVASFGASLALRGDELVVGAPTGMLTDIPNEGVFYVYRLGATYRDPVLTLKSPDPGFFFGRSVSLSARGLVVGAPFVEPPPSLIAEAGGEGAGNGARGSAFVYARDGRGNLSSHPCRLLAPDPGPCDVFGDWVAATDDYFVVAASRNDVAGSTAGGDASSEYLVDAGSAYVFTP